MRLNRLIFLTCAFLITLVLGASGWMISKPALPGGHEEIRFYSNQTGDDLRLIIQEALSEAHEKVEISIFNFSDRKLLTSLKFLQEKGIPISILADPSSYCLLKKLFTFVSKMDDLPGLMHRKIVAIDGHKLLIGSANFTKESLQVHENLLMYIDSQQLAESIHQGKGGGQAFLFNNQLVELWLLPKDRAAEARLLSLINGAQKSLKVAMFTWTSERFARACIAAHKRGVDVQVALDRQSAIGTSKKIARLLQEEGVPLFHNQGTGLLHHKFAVIDDETFICGSANWTVSAFTRNAEIVLVFNQLTETQQQFLDRLWNILSLPSKRQDALVFGHENRTNWLRQDGEGGREERLSAPSYDHR